MGTADHRGGPRLRRGTPSVGGGGAISGPARLLARAVDREPAPGLTIRTILVINRTLADGTVEPEHFDAELSWKGYALTARLHLLDHRTQVRKLRRTRGETQS